MKKIIVFFALLICLHFQAEVPLQTSNVEHQKKWVDSVFSTLSLDQKIGQLFMVQAYSNRSETETNFIKKMINQFQIGGLIFMQGTPDMKLFWNNQVMIC
ncbi:hypothetical protein LG651_07320 [Tamlana sp. 62-3]|uniref:Glycoside hydrolase family 3 N-terminal domain-containing protein n=1 Tax=Neotamlana sargassicola TaxID=2883125 RepID=A0A9X1I757_9FLAO|nr:hypothetical protein [Tamlana sargassicola]MCB4808060.1 hypothetical protein [Tamlana sargassicola]